MDRSTLRRIQKRTDISFSAKWRQVQQYAGKIIPPLDHLHRKIKESSNILLLDGKHVNILGESVCIHIAYDTAIGVVDFWIDDTENKTAYGYILQRLSERGYEPICCVSDDHFSITPLLRENGIPHQLCIFHLLRTFRSMLVQEDYFSSEIPPEHKVLYSRIKWIFKTRRIEDIPARVDSFRKMQKFWRRKKQLKALEWFWEKLPYAVMGLSFEENVPKTTALLENINGQIKQRLKTFRGVKSEDSLNKILKILFFFRNFK